MAGVGTMVPEGHVDAGRLTLRSMVFLVCGALVARLAYLFALTDVEATPSDASQYHELATNLAAGRGFVMHFPQLVDHPTAFRPPAYPALLGLWYRLAGPGVLGGKLLNVVLGVIAVVLIAVLANRVSGPRAGLAAGWVAAVFPPLIANDVNLLSEPLSLVLLLGMLVLLLDRRWAPAGLLLGLLLLTRPSAPLVVIVVGVWLATTVSWRAAAGALAIAAVVVVPWVVRNAVEVGLVDLTSSNGFNLAAMYSLPAQESGHFVDPVYDERFADRRLDQFDEAAWARRLRDDGLAGLQANPGYLVRNVAVNLVATLELRPAAAEPAELADGRNLTARYVGLPLVWAVLVLGSIGLWRLRHDAAGRLLIGVGAAVLVTNLLVLAPPRLRTPLDALLLVGAGGVIVVLVDAGAARWRERRVADGPLGLDT